ncbi:phosphate ABC transporter permease PstA [Baileyella intestinalis]|uniref:Phosphate transport system permease protein PstA n=1 Tax=Baileyella intestinalis TaxID=2606709 RepID=A0A6A8M943_9FIRM|nr:phosphate ABC transporter permease PstA [Baileyella intestinalis]MST68759.1 phosphate ABC transporter permease PstA [Baileyella intestinalis]
MNEKSNRYARVRMTDRFMTGFFYGIGGFFILLLIVLAAYIIIKGILSIYPGVFSFTRNGIGNQFFNTVYLVLLSLLISVPIGVAAGAYLAEYSKNGRATEMITISIEALSSLPSIVVGLFGYLVFILLTGMRWNLFAGALAVTILSLPTITTTTRDALVALPSHFRSGSIGLGATRWQTLWHVLLPACIPRIVTGIILVAGRGFGEAAALLYTAGQSTFINWANWDLSSPTCPLNPFRPGETLSLHIWVMRTEGSMVSHSVETANVSSMVLMIMVLGFSLLARYLSRKLDEKNKGASK